MRIKLKELLSCGIILLFIVLISGISSADSDIFSEDESKENTPPLPEISSVVVEPVSGISEDGTTILVVSVINNGGPSNEGYISVSFPNNEEILNVFGTGNEYNKLYPIGSTLHSQKGAITSVNPVAGLSDSNWETGQTESLTIKVKPYSGSSKLEFYVRAALRDDNRNFVRVPASSKYADQEGWYVSKHSIDIKSVTEEQSSEKYSAESEEDYEENTATKIEDPSPEIANIKSEDNYEDGTTTLVLSVINNGGPSNEGYISVSFPNNEEILNIFGTGNEYNKLYPIGSTLHSQKGAITSVNPVAGLSDSNWETGQTESLTIKVKPHVGSSKLEFYVRTALRDDNRNFIRVPTSSKYTDQEGWYVSKHSIDIESVTEEQYSKTDSVGSEEDYEENTATKKEELSSEIDSIEFEEENTGTSIEYPSPKIVSIESEGVYEGNTATIVVSVINDGCLSNEGYISVSFPNKEEVIKVFGTGSEYNKLYPVGSILHSQKGTIPSLDPVASLYDSNWATGQTESLAIQVKPNAGSSKIDFYVRSMLKDKSSNYMCTPASSEYTDQQGIYVNLYSIDVYSNVDQSSPESIANMEQSYYSSGSNGGGNSVESVSAQKEQHEHAQTESRYPSLPEDDQPLVPSASVNLHCQKTDVVLDENVLLKLSAVNIIGNPTMHLQVIIIPPSGWSVTSSEFVESGAGQYTATYDVGSSDGGKDIEIWIKPNQIGNFQVEGKVFYYFGNDVSTKEFQTLTLPIIVTSESYADSNPIPGYTATITFLAFCVGARRLKVRVNFTGEY